MSSKLDAQEAAAIVLALLLRVRRSALGTAVIDEIEAEAVRMLLNSANTLDSAWLEALPDFSETIRQVRSVDGPEVGEDVAERDIGDGGDHGRAWGSVGSGAYEGTDDLDFTSYNDEASSEVTLCVDFGTALTKAFASRGWGDQFELPIGRLAGGEHPFMVESSIWIEGEKIHFGPEAIRRSEKAKGQQQRLDSLKSHIVALGEVGSGQFVDEAFNPYAGNEDLTIAGLLTLYLAYIDQLIKVALAELGLPNHLRRRIARPCWTGEVGENATRLLKVIVAKSTIVSDTLGGELLEGVDIARACSVLDAVDSQLDEDELEVLVENVIDTDVSEPEAVVAPFDAPNDWHYLTVVDVGAGTTDVATFLLRFLKKGTRILLVPNSARSLPQGGDFVDRVLLEDLLEQLQAELGGKRIVRARAALQTRIREHKEVMFRDGELDLVVEDVSVYMELEDFLDRPELAQFGDALRDLVAASLASIPELHAQKIKEKGGVRMIFTGGGSGLPMVQSLRDGHYTAQSHVIYARDGDASPGWLIHRSEDFREIYPQLAVAAGGASPDLPERGP